MSAPYRELSERIRGEVPNLDWLVHRAQRAWEQLRRMPEEMAYLDSVALNLHGFYSGLERLFELIARHLVVLLPEHWPVVRAELLAFADFLEALGEARERT